MLLVLGQVLHVTARFQETLDDKNTVIDAPMKDSLIALQRCICTDPVCGGFRRIGARKCNGCNMDTAARPPAIGDCIAGSLCPGAADRQTAAHGDADETQSGDATANSQSNGQGAHTHTMRAGDPACEPVVLPADWTRYTLATKSPHSHALD